MFTGLDEGEELVAFELCFEDSETFLFFDFFGILEVDFIFENFKVDLCLKLIRNFFARLMPYTSFDFSSGLISKIR